MRIAALVGAEGLAAGPRAIPRRAAWIISVASERFCARTETVARDISRTKSLFMVSSLPRVAASI
jgi:hypothetical protein